MWISWKSFWITQHSRNNYTIRPISTFRYHGRSRTNARHGRRYPDPRIWAFRTARLLAEDAAIMRQLCGRTKIQAHHGKLIKAIYFLTHLPECFLSQRSHLTMAFTFLAGITEKLCSMICCVSTSKKNHGVEPLQRVSCPLRAITTVPSSTVHPCSSLAATLATSTPTRI